MDTEWLGPHDGVRVPCHTAVYRRRVGDAAWPGGAAKGIGRARTADGVNWRHSELLASCPRLSRASRSDGHCLLKRDGRDKPGHDVLLPQITAEALNARAGLFQRAGRGRIRNAERLADAEWRPLHDRDALRFQQF